MLVIKSLTLKYNKTTIFDNFNLDINDNEFVMLIGPNGSGKTSLITSILGFNKIDGEITIDDVNVKKMPISKRNEYISYVPQQMNISYRLTVLEFVSMGSSKYKNFLESNKKIEKDAIEILNKLNISYLKDKYIDSISMGEKRLCYIARCDMANSKWLLLDEATTSLDIKNEDMVLSYLKNYKNTFNKSILLSIHNPYMALLYADRIIGIESGKVVGNYLNNDEEKSKIIDMLKYLYGDIIVKILKEKI